MEGGPIGGPETESKNVETCGGWIVGRVGRVLEREITEGGQLQRDGGEVDEPEAESENCRDVRYQFVR